LRDAGWRGDSRLARFGYVAGSALRHGVGYTRNFVSSLLDESRLARMAQRMRCATEEVVDHLSDFLRFVLALGNEAWELLEEL